MDKPQQFMMIPQRIFDILVSDTAQEVARFADKHPSQFEYPGDPSKKVQPHQLYEAIKELRDMEMIK